MWTASRAPSRPQRNASQGSIHSIASVHSAGRPTSMSSPHHQRSGGYESDVSSDTANEEELLQNTTFPMVPSNNVPAMWQSGRQQSGSAISRLSQKFAATASVAEITPPPLRRQGRDHHETMENSSDDDVHSRSSTLGDGDGDFEFPEKTPTSLPRKNIMAAQELKESMEEEKPTSEPHVPGPLESQLASLMSKLIFMERANPVVSVTPDDYAAMTAELNALREEKKTWQKRHEALYALRDEDVENNIKIRGMLAKARRDLEAMTKLRNEDLINVQVVRSKLAEATRKLDRLEVQSTPTAGGRSSPSRLGRPGSMVMERRGTMDLFAAAKAAALEQRALELEQRNIDLLSQIDTLKGGANIDDLNRMTAHKAWKDTVTELETRLKAKDAELARLRSGAAAASSHARTGSKAGVGAAGVEWNRVEAIHEEHASYREKIGGRMQALRSEKEALQKELHRKEDENHALEVKILSLERRISIM